jgi:tripartite-type tricarboxylate transporter receptor subunit TctC
VESHLSRRPIERINAGARCRWTTCLLLHSLLGVQPTFIPFNGAAAAMNALLGGQVDYICNAIADSVPHVQGGTAKVYAITTAERSPALPNVPTSKEAARRCGRGS